MIDFNSPNLVNHLGFIIVANKHLMLIEYQIYRLLKIYFILEGLKDDFSSFSINNQQFQLLSISAQNCEIRVIDQFE